MSRELRQGSIFDALGGSDAIAAAVDGLYERLLADPRTAGYFEGVDLRRLNRHLRVFLTVALGGPEIYHGRDLRSAHAPLGITPQAWDATVAHLLAVLAELDVAADLVDRVVAKIAPLRVLIVTAP
ncbi:group 1 truncated hemoglobin [Dactylosporangium sp. NPDC051485]|uniref:group I truncated hemoglobin n=1 Tax=Dactylosporangium sp. NPDC051485 TaxID=3154846 RepID=UPI003432A8E5